MRQDGWRMWQVARAEGIWATRGWDGASAFHDCKRCRCALLVWCQRADTMRSDWLGMRRADRAFLTQMWHQWASKCLQLRQARDSMAKGKRHRSEGARAALSAALHTMRLVCAETRSLFKSSHGMMKQIGLHRQRGGQVPSGLLSLSTNVPLEGLHSLRGAAKDPRVRGLFKTQRRYARPTSVANEAGPALSLKTSRHATESVCKRQAALLLPDLLVETHSTPSESSIGEGCRSHVANVLEETSALFRKRRTRCITSLERSGSGDDGDVYSMEKARAVYERAAMRASLTRWMVTCHDKALVKVIPFSYSTQPPRPFMCVRI